MSLNKILKTIYKVSKKEKVEVYVVGGFVRDRLLGKSEKALKDVDFVVVGSGISFAHALDKEFEEMGLPRGDEVALRGSLVEFPDFDTARYVLPDLELEFAGARTEKYDAKSRKPKVVETSLKEDLKRRDFTVNALAIEVKKLKEITCLSAGKKLAKKFSDCVIDLFGGQEDLKNKILRTPLDPDTTFSEDPLRMMRAARFAAQLDFQIEPSALLSIAKNCKRLKIISAERIQEELLKLLGTSKPSVGLWILFQTKLLDEFMPEISALHGVEEIGGLGHKENLTHTFKVVDNIAERSDKALLRFAGLLHDVGKVDTKKFLKGRGWTFDMHEHLGKKIVWQIGKRLKLSNDDIKYLGKLVRWHQQPISLMDEGVTDSAVRRLIVNLGEELNDLLILCRSDITTGNESKLKNRLANYDYLEKRIAEVIETDKLRAFQSPVRGDEIMKECGLKPGPTIGKIKKALEEAILDGKVANDYEEVKRFFEEIKNEYISKAEDWERT